PSSTYSLRPTAREIYHSPINNSKVNKTPPVRFSPTIGSPGVTGQRIQCDFSSIKRRVTAAIEITPLAKEFSAAATDQRRVTTLDKIESLRLQTLGDQALRDGDTELARTFYQSAIRAASNRQTPWLRITWIYVVQRDYPKAATALNRAMLIRDATGGGWITAEQLLGDARTDRYLLSHNGLWTWLQDRPASADRLLLAAGYELFLGNGLAAQQFLELALSAGISQSSYETLAEISEIHLQMQNSDLDPDHRQYPSFKSPNRVSLGPATDPGELVSAPSMSDNPDPRANPKSDAGNVQTRSNVKSTERQSAPAVPRLPNANSE
ncbi:MAG: hypothetical protein MK102_11430, partial [Fuerstiella sp.]|nr:hypothetical protein [Fuerstiella sp.]